MANQEKTDIFQDFSLGLNTLTAPNRLDPKASPAQGNVWVDDGAVQKRLGQSRTSSTNTVYNGAWYGNSLHNSVFSAVENLIVYAYSATALRNILMYTTDSITVTAMDTGGTGTASTTVATAIVTGTGTNWLTTAAVGSVFSVSNTTGIILTVDSDTQLTLTAAFGVLNTTQAYKITASWPATTRVSYFDMNSKAWICGIGTTAVSFNGTVQAYVTAFPNAAYSLTYRNYGFAANTAANPSRISWCSLKDPTTWPASNFIDVNPDDGFPIVGLAYDGQSIIIFKTNAAYKLTGDIFDPSNPTYVLTQIFTPSDFNINSAKSFQLYGPNGYIMLGKKGFYAYNGGGAISKILNYDQIRAEFAAIGGFSLAGIPAVQTEPSSIIVDGNYWLQVANASSSISATNKEFTYVLDKVGAVWKWTQLGPAMVSDMAYRAGVLYGVNSYTSGTPGLLQLNTGNTDGLSSAINGSFTTKIFEFSNQQRFGVVYVYFKKQSAGNLTFEVSVDEGSFVSNTIDMTAGTGTRVKSAPIVVGRIGRSIQFRWSNNVAAQTFEVYAVELYRQELRR
jgi:hypothetical protein